MEDNSFWQIVLEIYPVFLQVILIYGAIRMVKGVMAKLKGDENSQEVISQTISDIVEGFFWAHILIPLVYGIWGFMGGFADKIGPVIKMIGQ